MGPRSQTTGRNRACHDQSRAHQRGQLPAPRQINTLMTRRFLSGKRIQALSTNKEKISSPPAASPAGLLHCGDGDGPERPPQRQLPAHPLAPMAPTRSRPTRSGLAEAYLSSGDQQGRCGDPSGLGGAGRGSVEGGGSRPTMSPSI
jgi:hypothetical protein